MKQLLARRPSPAMVVALVALCSSLTGGAVAAALITGADIKNGSIKGKDLARGSVNTKKVKDASLLAKDFAPGQLPAGAQGIQGPKGDKGDQGEPGTNGTDGTDGTNGTNGAPGTARAYALVNTNGTVVAEKSKNVVSVTHPFVGSYCVVLDPSIDATKVEGTVSPNYVSAPFLPIAQINADRSNCAGANAIKVQTSRVSQNSSTKDVFEDPEDSSFFIMVP